MLGMSLFDVCRGVVFHYSLGWSYVDQTIHSHPSRLPMSLFGSWWMDHVWGVLGSLLG